MKKTLLAVALTAASMTAIADVSVSGHANYKAGLLEDFQSGGVEGNPSTGQEGLTVGNANTSKSRFRIKSKINSGGITYGSNFEFGVNTGAPLDTRVNEVYVSGSLGKLSLGQGSSAGDGASENDFSGTYLLAGDLASWELKGKLADNGSKDINRVERIKYDAPAIGHLALSASINNGSDASGGTLAGDDNGNDVALSASYSLPAVKVSAATIIADEDNNDVVIASLAGKMANFTAAVQFFSGENNVVDNDVEQVRFIVGYNPGPFQMSVDFQQTENDDKTIDAETFGLNFVYNPTKGVELYAGARNAQADDGEFDEDAFLLGARVKF